MSSTRQLEMPQPKVQTAVSPKPAPDYITGYEVFRELAGHVRTLEIERKRCDAIVDEARKANGIASNRVSAAVRILRDLTAALSLSAGHDKTYDLADTIAQARQIIDETKE